MISLLMLGSLVLGLIAWILPIMKFRRIKNVNWAVQSILSLSACAISLCFQIIYNNHIVRIGDWSALMDTTGTSTILSVVLLVLTIILNAINMNVNRHRTISYKS